MLCNTQRNIFTFRALLGFLLVLLLLAPLPVFAQIGEPDAGFSISQVEAYRHVSELNDQLYLVTGTVEYNTTPSIGIDDAYLVRLMNGATELASTTFYAYHDSGYDFGLCSIYFAAADAPTWSGAYTVKLQGNPTLHWLDDTAVTAMSGALAYDAPAYTDETAASNSAAANDMTLLPAAPAVGDMYYFGSSGMFNILTVNVGQNGNWTGTYTWEYWDGGQWRQPAGLTDGSTGFTAGTGNRDITFTCPTDWQQTTVNGTTLYWLRFRVVTYTAIVAQPLGTQSWTNTLATPPATDTSTISWIDEGSVSAAQARLTTRLRFLAQLIENDWGGSVDLVETISTGRVLTTEGEDYFGTAIANLRDICPGLFGDVITTPEFTSDVVIEDFYTEPSDSDYDTYGVNWYAQTFTAQSVYEMKGVELRLLRAGNPGNVTVSVRATAAGLPTGADLASGVLNGNALTTAAAGQWYEIPFTTFATGDTVSIAFNTTYAFVVRAVGGNAANYTGWRADSAAGFANGQACSSTDSGATWAAVAGNEDALFVSRGLEAHSLSFRNKLAGRLVGTRFDFTNNFLGISRMWFSGLLWIIVACAFPTAFFVRAVNTTKGASLIFLFMFVMGAPAGFVYLEQAIIAGFLMMVAAVYPLLFRGSP